MTLALRSRNRSSVLSAGRSALTVGVSARVDAIVFLRRAFSRVVAVADFVTVGSDVARNIVSAHVQDGLTVRGFADSLFLFVFGAPDAQEATRKN